MSVSYKPVILFCEIRYKQLHFLDQANFYVAEEAT